MSWSFQALGKGSAVAKKAAEEFAKKYCEEPEESARQKAGEVIQSLCASAPDLGFNINAYGSMGWMGVGEEKKITTHSYKLEIQTVQIAE